MSKELMYLMEDLQNYKWEMVNGVSCVQRDLKSNKNVYETEENKNCSESTSMENLQKIGQFSKTKNLYTEDSVLKSEMGARNFKLPQLVCCNTVPVVKEGAVSDGFVDFHDMNSLPTLKLEDVKDKRKIKDVVAAVTAIEELEKHFMENCTILEKEKCERMKIQEEICIGVNNNDMFQNITSDLFRQCCIGEIVVECENDNEQHDNCEYNDKTEVSEECAKTNTNTRNFIRRNIELAAVAMSKLPLTDEEKQHLEDILADIDTDGNPDDNDEKYKDIIKKEQNIEEMSNDTCIPNAFQLSENDRKRLNEIDYELENNFCETRHLRSTDIADSFWTNLIIDEMLSNIEVKLARIQQEDVTQETAIIS